MKKLIKLMIFFSFNFILIFAAATGLRFLILRLDYMRIVPHVAEMPLSLFINSAHWGLSFALYGSLLLGLSYAARQRVFAPLAVLFLCILSLVAGFGAFTGLQYWQSIPAIEKSIENIGGPGLILTNSLNGNETSVILLKGGAEPAGPRVVAIPGRPLLYQEEAPQRGSAQYGLPPVPFRDETPWFLKSLAIDIRLSAEQMAQRRVEGMLSFGVYSGALIICLTSLGFIFKLSAWPLANLFLGCLAFRGILALETFFNSPDMQIVFDSFLQERLSGRFTFGLDSASLATPLIFCGFGLLIYVYSVLVYFAKRRDSDED